MEHNHEEWADVEGKWEIFVLKCGECVCLVKRESVERVRRILKREKKVKSTITEKKKRYHLWLSLRIV